MTKQLQKGEINLKNREKPKMTRDAYPATNENYQNFDQMSVFSDKVLKSDVEQKITHPKF